MTIPSEGNISSGCTTLSFGKCTPEHFFFLLLFPSQSGSPKCNSTASKDTAKVGGEREAKKDFHFNLLSETSSPEKLREQTRPNHPLGEAAAAAAEEWKHSCYKTKLAYHQKVIFTLQSALVTCHLHPSYAHPRGATLAERVFEWVLYTFVECNFQVESYFCTTPSLPNRKDAEKCYSGKK